MDPLTLIRTILMCYLIGSFPSAYLIGKLNGINIFEIGSGNMGTANTLRAVGWKWGGVVMAMDLLKGVVAVGFATVLLPNGYAQVIGALAAIIGHNWSVIAAVLTGQLRGGKGAATWLGTFIVMAPFPAVAIILVAFVSIILLTRYISLAVLTSVALGGLAMVLLTQLQIDTEIFLGTSDLYLLYGVVAAIIIFYRHRANIQRLLTGTERRIGEKA